MHGDRFLGLKIIQLHQWTACPSKSLQNHRNQWWGKVPLFHAFSSTSNHHCGSETIMRMSQRVTAWRSVERHKEYQGYDERAIVVTFPGTDDNDYTTTEVYMLLRRSTSGSLLKVILTTFQVLNHPLEFKKQEMYKWRLQRYSSLLRALLQRWSQWHWFWIDTCWYLRQYWQKASIILNTLNYCIDCRNHSIPRSDD